MEIPKEECAVAIPFSQIKIVFCTKKGDPVEMGVGTPIYNAFFQVEVEGLHPARVRKVTLPTLDYYDAEELKAVLDLRSQEEVDASVEEMRRARAIGRFRAS